MRPPSTAVPPRNVPLRVDGAYRTQAPVMRAMRTLSKHGGGMPVDGCHVLCRPMSVATKITTGGRLEVPTPWFVVSSVRRSIGAAGRPLDTRSRGPAAGIGPEPVGTDAAIVAAFHEAGERRLTTARLHQALTDHGYSRRGFAHLIRKSPILRRVGYGRYELRRAHVTEPPEAP